MGGALESKTQQIQVTTDLVNYYQYRVFVLIKLITTHLFPGHRQIVWWYQLAHCSLPESSPGKHTVVTISSLTDGIAAAVIAVIYWPKWSWHILGKEAKAFCSLPPPFLGPSPALQTFPFEVSKKLWWGRGRGRGVKKGRGEGKGECLQCRLRGT